MLRKAPCCPSDRTLTGAVQPGAAPRRRPGVITQLSPPGAVTQHRGALLPWTDSPALNKILRGRMTVEDRLTLAKLLAQ